jgi:hypothetical protein
MMGDGGRVFGTDPWVSFLVKVFFWYLSYEIILKLVCQSWEKTDVFQYRIVYIHHILTALLCIHVLTYRVFEYYALFFIGVAEASSIPLACMNFFKLSKELEARHKTLTTVLKMVFAFAFFGFRVVWWLKVDYSFWGDVLDVIGNAALVQRHGIPIWHLYAWLASNALLTAMQLFWATKVAKAIYAFFSSFFSGRKADKKKA